MTSPPPIAQPCPSTLQRWADVLTWNGRVWLVSRLLGRAQGVPSAPESVPFLAHRLARFVLREGLPALDALVDDENVDGLCRIIAVRHSWFWREPDQFSFLLERIAPRLAAGMPVRIWCAAASAGQEAYSLAIAVLQALGEQAHDVRVLATDLDAVALDVGRRGRYDEEAVAALPQPLRRWIEPTQNPLHAEPWQVRAELAAMVEFRTDNLLNLRQTARPDAQTPCHRGDRFDAIFCRNVLMYFEPSYRYAVLENLASCLAPGGLLCLGASESAGPASHMFEPCGRGMYLGRRDSSCPSEELAA